MIRHLRFELEKERAIIIGQDRPVDVVTDRAVEMTVVVVTVQQQPVVIDPAILQVARNVHALNEPSVVPPPQPSNTEMDTDEIICTGSQRCQREDTVVQQQSVVHVEVPQPSFPYRLSIAQRHRGLAVWKLSLRRGSALIWDRKIHLQQFLSLSPDLKLPVRKKIIQQAKFFEGTKIISKRDWLVPPAFLARHAELVDLQAEAKGYINLASSHLAEPPMLLRCCNCPRSDNVISTDMKEMYKHVSNCLGTHDPEQLHGFCACGRLFATKNRYDQHGEDCQDLKDIMDVIMK